MSLWANQVAEGLKEKGCSQTSGRCHASFIRNTFNKLHWGRAAVWLVGCGSPGHGRWGGGGASRPWVGGVSSVGGLGPCIDGSVRHRSLVSWARATVVISPVCPPTVPAHHHDNGHPLTPWQPLHLWKGLVNHITVTTTLLSPWQPLHLWEVWVGHITMATASWSYLWKALRQVNRKFKERMQEWKSNTKEENWNKACRNLAPHFP